MKKITFLITILLIVNFCFSQENGVVSYTITSNWLKRYASCEYISKAERERMSYVWSGDDNEWEEKWELKFNASAYLYVRKANEDSRWRQDDYIIYRDREKNETFDLLSLLNKKYVKQDSIACQSWRIKNDMREIAGRICMNATCYDSIKGKEITAWFALDLPIPIGPDIYCGLPGMILEVNEANGAKVYTATNILLPEEKIEIEKPAIKKNRKSITFQEYNAILNKYINECKKMERPYFWGIPF
jgi:GLPGLI family protein